MNNLNNSFDHKYNFSNLDSSSLPSILNEQLTNSDRHEGELTERENSPFLMPEEERSNLTFQASTSQSVEQLNGRSRNKCNRVSKKNRRRRRIYSDTDLSKMRYFS
jgi:hypothetical protein